uniref:Transducer of regulated CREB activity C-terminal domain-containing protein n=1 Tax=Fundulus heteroclitus TaxID=8078 RepID=A0A3Q2PTN5_FUNHE
MVKLSQQEVAPFPVRSLPVRSLPVRSLPVRSLPVRLLPVRSPPVRLLPVRSLPVRLLPVRSLPVRSLPVTSCLHQGVPLDTSKLPLDQRLPPYPLSQSHQHQSPPGQQPHSLGQHHGQHQQHHGQPPLLLQFTAENPADGLSLNHSGPSQNRFPSNSQGPLEMQESGDQQQLNNQNQNYSGGDGRQNVPNIILTGDSPTGLSKEIASALSHVPGFEMDPFSLDEQLRMDPLSLDMLEGELMLADPAVEDSFRSDRLK